MIIAWHDGGLPKAAEQYPEAVIFADNDAPGRKAAAKTGLPVYISENPGFDPWDVWNEGGRKAVFDVLSGQPMDGGGQMLANIMALVKESKTTERDVDEALSDIRRRMKENTFEMLQLTYAAGLALNWLKANLEHGQYMAWIEDNGMNERQARRWMRVTQLSWAEARKHRSVTRVIEYLRKPRPVLPKEKREMAEDERLEREGELYNLREQHKMLLANYEQLQAEHTKKCLEVYDLETEAAGKTDTVFSSTSMNIHLKDNKTNAAVLGRIFHAIARVHETAADEMDEYIASSQHPDD